MEIVPTGGELRGVLGGRAPWGSSPGSHLSMWTSLPGVTEGLGTGSVRPLFRTRSFVPMRDTRGWLLTASSERSGRRIGSRLGRDPRVSREGRALNSEDAERLEQFERRIQRRPGLGKHWRRQNNRSKLRLRVLVHATWYVLLAAAGVSTIYYLLVI
jgi:hypothetical protein